MQLLCSWLYIYRTMHVDVLEFMHLRACAHTEYFHNRMRKQGWFPGNLEWPFLCCMWHPLRKTGGVDWWITVSGKANVLKLLQVIDIYSDTWNHVWCTMWRHEIMVALKNVLSRLSSGCSQACILLVLPLGACQLFISDVPVNLHHPSSPIPGHALCWDPLCWGSLFGTPVALFPVWVLLCFYVECVCAQRLP